MNIKKTIFNLLLITTSFLYSQTSGILDLRTDYFNNFEVYYLLDFDFNNGRNNPDMFSYTLSYTPSDPLGAPIRITLEFEWIATVPSLNMNNKRIVYIMSKPFDFKGEVRLTTKDLDQNMNKLYYTDGRPVPISIDHFEQDIQQLKSGIMQTGKLPAGSYVFRLNIGNEAGAILKSQTQEIVVSNPTTIELIAPGGALEENIEVATNFPQFQWESIDFMWSERNCPSCGYGIRVVEFNPARHSSIEEALHDNANLPYPDNGGYYRLPKTPVNQALGLYTATTTFQYPLTGAKPLEAGKIYVWQVRKTYPTTSGPETVESNIYVFKIRAATTSSSTTDQLLTLLSQLLSPDTYNQLFSGELMGYAPTGQITLNGTQTLTYEQLSQLVAQFLGGQITIKSVTVE